MSAIPPREAIGREIARLSPHEPPDPCAGIRFSAMTIVADENRRLEHLVLAADYKRAVEIIDGHIATLRELIHHHTIEASVAIGMCHRNASLYVADAMRIAGAVASVLDDYGRITALPDRATP